MRLGPLAALLLILASPSALAAPRDCTGLDLPTTIGALSVECEENVHGETTTRREVVTLDMTGTDLGVLILEHSHTFGDQSGSRCAATYHSGRVVPTPTIQYGTGCAGVRHPLLP